MCGFGDILDGFNFSTERKRILNHKVEVNFDDNVKQVLAFVCLRVFLGRERGRPHKVLIQRCNALFCVVKVWKRTSVGGYRRGCSDVIVNGGGFPSLVENQLEKMQPTHPRLGISITVDCIRRWPKQASPRSPW